LREGLSGVPPELSSVSRRAVTSPIRSSRFEVVVPFRVLTDREVVG
jgi:hypothetical protein